MVDPAPPVRAALAQATAALMEVSPTARLDAELLMAHALGISRSAMLLDALECEVPVAFKALVARRLRHEPIAHLTGMRGFWTIDLEVGPGALVPRADSETLIEAAVAHFAGTAGPFNILDLGTGPGTLLLAALDQWPAARGLGVERSAAARGYALRNVARLGMAARAHVIGGDWATAVAGQFDLVFSNPPYVADADCLPREVADYDPAEALFGGEDGLDAYRLIVPALPDLIAPGGIAVLEIGATQGDAVSEMVRAAGLVPSLRCDLGDRARAVVARH
ncbi:MAG: peptide chain release factor N(5)-glutamine methyltransferase [Sphingobium sp.]|nr:peptide chain release factor N(5)-glutamine methyltransferase [Sphingobium sp.]